MCGIFGSSQRLSDGETRDVLGLLHHRGPDSCGHEWIGVGSGGVHFLHTRLAIQDLSVSGHQPMASADGRWWVTYNGEIYNHFELRDELDANFRGTSDTETLVEYLARYGIDRTVARLNGIFALAAVDRETGTLVLVRDHFGIKPLYYEAAGGSIRFSSELKPLLRTGGSGGLHRPGLHSFLALRYIPSPDTLIEGVSRVPPGHYLAFDLTTGESRMVRYVEAETRRFEGGFDEAVTRYHALLAQAVERQMLSDVPIGVLLSGGIDSALVAALAREKSSRFCAYTVGFGDQYADCEIEDAAETARVLDIPHRFVTVTPADLLGSLDRVFQAVEEPLGTTSIMPMWYLSELARSEATVVLTGQGSDEPWGGYRRYQIELLLGRFPWLRHSMFRLPQTLTDLSDSDAVRRGLHCLGQTNTAHRFADAYALFNEREMSDLMQSRVDYPVTQIQYWLSWLDAVDHIGDAERMMRVDTRMNLADDLLLYGDKISMAFALEARVPILDVDLVAFIESLPLAYRTSLRETKRAHRAMASAYLPSSIINRKKKGFQVPFGEWSRGIWREAVESRLLDPGLKIHRCLHRPALERLWRDHQRGAPDLSRQFFALLMLSGWCENFL